MRNTHTHTRFKQVKQIVTLLVLFCFFKSYSQQSFDVINLSPEGKLDKVCDNRGNQLKLKDILIDNPNNPTNSKTITVTCSTTSYFNLYFETGCGMEDASNPTHNARRAVLCKVFEDISNFINSPLSTTGNKVNIWVKNIANENVPNGTLGVASSYYVRYTNGTNTIGGILDGEIWKTIHLGLDSYTNVSSGTNLFYHGKVSFNFNDPSVNWNTNLAINTPSDLYDLYTVMLHEIVHSLGIGSFINQNGASIDPSPFFSRYDTFLQTNSNQPLLTIGSCSMYDLNFNSAVSPTFLRPGCNLPDNLSNGVLNTTICNNAIKYVGSSTVPVYTPTCFELGSSLSHFEDLLFPNCSSHYVNDNYFVLSNVNLMGVTKRYLKSEEKNVLCDIGYNLQTTFGTTSTSNGFYDYGGASCSGITVAGVNDGLNIGNGSYTFIGNQNTNITINGATLLNNDVNATEFDCLQDLTASATLSTTSGNASTTIYFSSLTNGLHILRYIPINGIKRGNITYVYVYVRSPANVGGCSPTPSACSLVMNGDFEQISSLDAPATITKACGWDSVYQSSSPLIANSSTPTYYNSTSNPLSLLFGVPCNWLGFQSCNNNIGNGYANISISTGVSGKQHLYTTLKTPLQPNTNYQLSFDVSLADGYSYWASNLQACLHKSTTNPPSILAYNSNGDVDIVNNATDATTLLVSPSVIRNTSGWDTVTFNFTTTTGGEQFLYLGLLKNAILLPNLPASIGIGGCTYQSASLNAFGNKLISYYIDNVSLIPTNGVLFNIPNTINCNTQLSSDLTNYISGAPITGTFSGNGIVFSPNDGTYSFNPQLAGNGLSTLTYSYNNSSGCLITINTVVDVTTVINPIITGVTSVCLGNGETYTADVPGGTWSTSNTSVADINSITGEIDAFQAGVVDINYTVTNGFCTLVSTLQLVVFDPHIIPSFSFPTTICLGSTSPILPHLSDNGIPGNWVPPIIDNHVTANYTFKPTNNCNDLFVQTITVINGGHLTANPDTLLIPYSSTAQISPNFLLNDTFDGNLLTSNYLGLLINLTSTSNGITVNQDGTLNIPAGLQPGLYTIKYLMKNTCMISNQTTISITIYDATIDASKKVSFNVCYEPSAYTTHDSLLQNVTVGNFHADANNILFTNVTAPNGFSINADGTINIPLNSLPGTYAFTYDLCPISGTTGCVTGITFQLGIDTTVRANPDVFYYGTSGTYYGSLYSGTTNINGTNNILLNDGYAQDCGYSAPNSFAPAVLNGNVINLTVDSTGLQGKFTINNSNGNINQFPGSTLFPASYPFTYTICDLLHPAICSTTNGWISVIADSAKMANIITEHKSLEKTSIYPNPSNGIFTIDFENRIKEVEIEVYSLLGQKIFKTSIFDVTQSDIDLSNFINGAYLIKISDGLNLINYVVIKK